MDSEKKFNEIITKTLDYLNKNNIRTIIVGLSGCLDSTVMTIIANEIVSNNPGQFELIGVYLPSEITTKEEDESAEAIGNLFCTRFISYPIDHIVAECSNIMGYEYDKSINNTRARIRTTILYNIANNEPNSIILDGSNLTEIKLGKHPIHGNAGDLAILSSLWKHEIYELALWMYHKLVSNKDEQRADALFGAIGLAPELNTISNKLDYGTIDEILLTFIEKIKPYYNIIEEPIDPKDPEFMLKLQAMYMLKELVNKHGEDVYKIINMHMDSEFKRKRHPVLI